MEVQHIDGGKNEADICTKNVAARTHEKHRSNIRDGRLNFGNLIQFALREDVEMIRASESISEKLVDDNVGKNMSDLTDKFNQKYKVHLEQNILNRSSSM